MDDHSLGQLIEILKNLTVSYLDRLERLCEENKKNSFDQFSRSVKKEFGSSPTSMMLVDWLDLYSNLSVNELELVLQTVKFLEFKEKVPKMQLVWSGPLPEGIPIRSTEQVIIELIENASESLFISSFAVYKAKNVLEKIKEALDRGINVSILFETPDSSHFKIKVDPLKILPDQILEKANIYIWPFNKRIKNEKDDVGSLHAKFVIQDDSRLFISSANLTESAFERNIELGVLIYDKAVIRKLKDHLKNLINIDVFVNVHK